MYSKNLTEGVILQSKEFEPICLVSIMQSIVMLVVHVKFKQFEPVVMFGVHI